MHMNQLSAATNDFVSGMRHMVRTHQLRQLLNDPSGQSRSQRAETLVRLFCFNRLRLVADPRDRIYGMLGVCIAFFGDFLTPDYTASRSLAQVYTDFAWRLIEVSGSLAILNQAGYGPKATSSFPSWVPNWNSAHDFSSEYYRLSQWSVFAAFGQATEAPHRVGNSLVVNGCSLGRVEDVFIATFDAEERKLQLQVIEQAFLWIVEGYSLSGLSLRAIVGWMFSTQNLTIFEEDEDQIHFRCSWQDYGTSKVRTSMYRWNRDKAQSQFHRAWLATLIFRGTVLDTLSVEKHIVHVKVRQAYDALMLFSSIEHSPDNMSNAAALFLGMRHCTLFKTIEGQFGVGPLSVQQSDIVAILSGANVPFILRQAQAQTESGQPRYTLVGEAYLLGYMDGGGRQTNGILRPLKEFCLD
jgi:hypothetical protein